MISKFDQYWERIKTDDEKAFEMLFKETFSTLCYFSGQITNDAQLSEEIVQDVFEKIWQSRDIILITSSFKAYLFQAVRNHSLNAVRKKGSRRLSFSKPVSEETWKFFTETFECDDFIIERITADETGKAIEQAVDSLPPQSRTVFKLSRFENKSPDEIAAELNISVNTVRSHIYTALQKISKLLLKDS